MPNEFIIQNADIVNEGSVVLGDVWIRDGMIHQIAEHIENSDGATVIDARGKYLIPGVIDDQVHFRDPGFPEKGDLSTESRAAVAGGVTSFMDMPNTNPKATTLEVLEEKYTLAAEKSLANYSFFLGATNDNIGEIRSADPHKICGLKVFMGASTGNMLVDNEETLEAIFRESQLLIAIHAEDEPTVRANMELFRKQYGEDIPVSAHPLIRSAEACYLSSVKAATLARKHNTRLHILHMSTARETDLLDAGMPLEDKKITGEVCVHHLWFDDRDYERLGALIKWNPAIKGESDKLALMEAVISGKIDLIATDHAPHTLAEKQNPYASCPSGGPLIQHSLPIMLEFVHQGKMTIEQVIRAMCHNPAILYRIRQRGFIREGFYADLTLVDSNAPWTVDKNNILYRCGWSPFEGVTFHSRVTHTFVNGNLVYQDGVVHDSSRGQRLLFN